MFVYLTASGGISAARGLAVRRRDGRARVRRRPSLHLQRVSRDPARGARRQVGISVFDAASDGSAVSALCDRPAADCGKGARGRGLRPGGYLAVRAHNHDARTRRLRDRLQRRRHAGGPHGPWSRRGPPARGRCPATGCGSSTARSPTTWARATAARTPARRAHGTAVRRRGEPVPRAGRLRLVPCAALRGGRRDRRPLLLPRRRRLFVQPAVRPRMADAQHRTVGDEGEPRLARVRPRTHRPAARGAAGDVLRRPRADHSGDLPRGSRRRLRLGARHAGPAITDADTFSARWTGTLTTASSEPHTFALAADDGGRLWLDGELLIDAWNRTSPDPARATVALTAGTAYAIRLEYREDAYGASAQLRWSTPTRAEAPVPAAALAPGPYAPRAPSGSPPDGGRPAVVAPGLTIGPRVKLRGGRLPVAVTCALACRARIACSAGRRARALHAPERRPGHADGARPAAARAAPRRAHADGPGGPDRQDPPGRRDARPPRAHTREEA